MGRESGERDVRSAVPNRRGPPLHVPRKEPGFERSTCREHCILAAIHPGPRIAFSPCEILSSMQQRSLRGWDYSDCYRPRSHVIVAAPRRHVVKARRCALPIHREETASKRRSESTNFEYQKVRPSAAAGGEAPPGLMNKARTIRPMMTGIPMSVAGSAMLELEASRADTSGREAECEPLSPDAFPAAALGDVEIPELGTKDVTLVGTVVLGATALRVPAMAAGAVFPAVEVEA